MTFPINTAIPNANNDPADDVTPMNTNFVNINDYLQVDHVAPGSQGLPGNGGAGTHEQVTYNNKNNQAAQTDPTSVSYTTDGSVLSGFTPAAANTTANLVFRNQRGIFPGSVIKAFGVFPSRSTVGAVNLTNGINVDNIQSLSGPFRLEITLKANATVNGVGNVVALAWVNTTLINGVAVSSFSNNVLTVTNTYPAGTLINFVVLQF